MSTIAICYIATGPYKLLWNEFYDSFEKHFAIDAERKEYFVFTDEPSYFEDFERVHAAPLDVPLPWPLPTLLRFHYFLLCEQELAAFDYVFFTNANLECRVDVLCSEVLPDQALGQNYTFQEHVPIMVHFRRTGKGLTYEQNSESSAFIPISSKSWEFRLRGRIPENERDRWLYVMGGFFGGTSEAFLQLSRELAHNIETDLRKNIIAIWHDESHLNHFVHGRSDYRLLNYSYLHPDDYDLGNVPENKLPVKIASRNSRLYFDRASIKDT